MKFNLSQPLLSIVIPTKNRYEYLENLLNSLLLSTSEEFEIVIQDNSDDNSEFLNFIDKFNNDGRLKYNHTSDWLSVIDNCDLGIENATGLYICMLGDDDGILIENSVWICHWLLEKKFEAALVNVITYSWPDTKHAVWSDRLSGRLEKKLFSFKSEIIDAQKELKRVCDNGGALGLGKLPRVYQAFVSKIILSKLKKEAGSYFPGPSPDMSNAIGITKYMNEFIYLDFPSIISGHSKKSTAGQGGMKEHHGAIENQKHLPKNTKLEWTKEIPLFWSGPTIYAESASKALQRTNNFMYKLNFNFLYACCLVYEKNYSSIVFEKMFSGKSIRSRIGITLVVIIDIVHIVFKRGINLFKNIFKYYIFKDEFYQASNIEEAITILKEKHHNVFIEH